MTATNDLLARLESLRADFPILSRSVNGKPLVYLDSTATSQKPASVIESMNRYYREFNANVHRGAYQLSTEATEAYELARVKLARFVGSPKPEQIVFTRNTTESINAVAYGWGLKFLSPGDEIVVTELEHHSNLVPWHLVAGYRGASLRAVRASRDGRLDLEHYAQLLKSGRVKMVALGHVCNSLGTVNPVQDMISLAHEAGALALIDGAQSVPHLRVDVTGLDADFYAWSAHKMLGPTGIGGLYGKLEHLRAMNPFLGGGEMIAEVYTDRSTYADLPHKLEAGTPAIAEAVGFGAAVDYLERIGMDAIWAHERELISYALSKIDAIPGVESYGPRGEDRAGVLSFNVSNIHAHDVASFLDQDGVCVRAGHHCAQPAMRALGCDSTARASFYLYNTRAEVDAFIASLARCAAFFNGS